MTDRQFKVLVVLVSLWGAVLEGTLLSIRVALENQPALAPAKVIGGMARFARDNTEYRATQGGLW